MPAILAALKEFQIFTVVFLINYSWKVDLLFQQLCLLGLRPFFSKTRYADWARVTFIQSPNNGSYNLNELYTQIENLHKELSSAV